MSFCNRDFIYLITWYLEDICNPRRCAVH